MDSSISFRVYGAILYSRFLVAREFKRYSPKNMKCNVCGQPIYVNFGNGNIVLCEEHASLSEEDKNQIRVKFVNVARENKPALPFRSLIFIFIIELLLLIPWLALCGLSGMAYDSGKIWPAIIVVGPFQAYPVFIFIAAVLSILFHKKKKYNLVLITAFSPIIVSFGWLLGMFVFAGFYTSYFKPLFG